LVFRRGSTVGAHEEASDIVEGNNGRDSTFHAVVAEFNNKVDSEHTTIPISKVNATVRYDFFDDRKSIEIDRGVWLTDGSTVDFDVNDTRRLLIATLEGDYEERWVYALDGSYSQNPKRVPLSEPLTQVHVILIGQQQRKIIKQFDFMLEVCRESDFLATFCLTDLTRWKHDKLFNLLVRGNNLLNEYTSQRNFAALRGLAVVGWEEAAEKIEQEAGTWAADASKLLAAHVSEQHQFKLIKAVSATRKTYDLEQTIKNGIRVIHETIQELDGLQPKKEDLKRFVKTFGPFA
jgi:hypothetical protein